MQILRDLYLLRLGPLFPSKASPLNFVAIKQGILGLTNGKPIRQQLLELLQANSQGIAESGAQCWNYIVAINLITSSSNTKMWQKAPRLGFRPESRKKSEEVEVVCFQFLGQISRQSQTKYRFSRGLNSVVRWVHRLGL